MTSVPTEPRSDRDRDRPPSAGRPPVPGRTAAGMGGVTRGRMRVLVADDDERSLDCLVALLDREGFSIDPAHGGLEALARLGLLDVTQGAGELGTGEKEAGDVEAAPPHAAAEDLPLPYDFMVLDYNMPDLNGVEVMQRVRVRLGGALPAIMVSGDYSRELMRSWNAVGGFSLLPKPVQPVDFRHQVNLLIQRFFGGALS